MDEMKILLVCKGNICRSPLAHGLLDKKVKEHSINWVIDSAGTGHWHIGKLPDSRSIKVGAEHDLDITYQRARQFSISDFDAFDKIYVMDSINYDALSKMASKPSDMAKVDFIMNELYPETNTNVPDPFHNGVEDFLSVYVALDQVTDAIVKRVK